jgi:hypothetical protein
MPSVIAYSFRFKSTTEPTRRVGRACATDRARILKVEMEQRLDVSADWPEIVEAGD